MKGTVTIPKWVYVVLMAGAIMNLFSHMYTYVKEEPKIHIYYHDERK